MSTTVVEFHIGQVWVNAAGHRWRVVTLTHDGRAVLESCSSWWAKTIPLTVDEWREGGRWQVER